ncbi:WD40-repeat-containing domain protein [Aspergillus caelatus]|uniref:WD40-repeat-containing domain protein n=1 Tax=Aspergillus caelatus TaxID=61420 RepID=A0A5N6ZLI9_9EURO|nr:WD40-repeat-containing domain protein [Aspergillus caelatus]KAE8358477.1 WD40-repeat-containing domain protein [Aspergillus caelatus]
MAYNSLNAKGKAVGAGSSLRITPTNSPGLRPPRTPNKAPQHQATLSLQTVIGTTTTSPHGFSSHDQSKSFAICAGSAAILAELDEAGNVNQRFFRARPSASSVHPVTSFYHQSTPPSTPDTRTRPLSGVKSTAHNAILSGSPANELAESNSSRAWSSRERVKAVTSVSISPNGRFLAVGETGYGPRVLIYSTAKDAPSDVPLSILTEHTFGVRGLAFSSDSQYLATLGDTNDGFLFVWSVSLKSGAAKLHLTNKCTSSIRDMCFMGQTLITVGVRHVKVWRLPETRPASPTKTRHNMESAPSSPSFAPRALSGRNCLLGSLAESTFTSVASVSDHEAVVGTDTGALCFLSDAEGSQKITLVENVGFSITSLMVDSDRSCVWAGGRGRRMQRFPFEVLQSSAAPLSPGLSETPSEEQKCRGPAIACMGSLTTHIVTVDTTRAIHIYPFDAVEDEQSHVETTMPAHRDAVLGIGPLKVPNDLEADFFTWSCNGTVNFWDTLGKCRGSRVIPLEEVPGVDEEASNELRVVRASDGMNVFVSGDKFGVLRVLEGQSWKCMNQVRAHGAEVTGIALSTAFDSCLIASCGRDRMVQLFQITEDSLKLVQTMDDHVGAVGQVLFINDGEILLSCSADRTVLIRERVTREADEGVSIAYMISKVITLKSSPVSMSLSADDTDVLVISTADRCVHQYEIPSGRHLNSIRAVDSDSNDAVVMGALTVAGEILGHSPKLLIGVASTDKSIRVYDLDRGVLLTGEFGHTEGVSDVQLLERNPDPSSRTVVRTLISSGMDGVVMMWNISVQPLQAQEITRTTSKEEDEGAKEMTLSRPPIRKILSKNELAEFRHEHGTGSSTPTREQSPPLIRKLSKLSLAPSSTKNGDATPPTPTPASARSSSRLERSRRTPSPPSPKSTPAKKTSHLSHSNHRSPLDIRSRTRYGGKTEFGSLNMSTEQVCRTLRAYRKKLNGTKENLPSQKELERELGLTLRALHHRTKGSESTETETDSSGKENENLNTGESSVRNLNIHAHPTCNLSQKQSPTSSSSHSTEEYAE